MPNALSATTLPIYPGLGQAPNNSGLHTQRLGSYPVAILLQEPTAKAKTHSLSAGHHPTLKMSLFNLSSYNIEQKSWDTSGSEK